MTPSTFAAILEDRLKHIEDAVALIEKGEGGTPALDSLRSHVIAILEYVKRNPGIEAAASDLYEVAARTGVEGAREHQGVARNHRIFQEAALRFRDRLTTAQPKAKSQS